MFLCSRKGKKGPGSVLFPSKLVILGHSMSRGSNHSPKYYAFISGKSQKKKEDKKN